MSKRFLPAVIGCFLAPFLLAGCNGGEDFSDADIGGPVIQPEPGGGGPLGPDVENVSISFYDDRLENLGYECFGGDGYSGGGYIARNEDGSDTDDEGEHLPLVATCAKEATRVEFFIGDFGNRDKRLTLGTYYLPQQVQQTRYQIAPTDIVQSPARIIADTSDVENRKALFVAALLQALDNEGDGITQVPDAAHKVVNDCCPDGTGQQPPSNKWDHDNYGQFESAWTDWINEVQNVNNDSAITDFTSRSTVDANLNATLDRLRAGTYRIVSAPYTRDFVENGEGAPFVPPMVLQMPILVYPDGEVQGMGYAADVTNSNDNQQIEDDALVALESGARMNSVLRFEDSSGDDFWSLSEVPLNNAPSVQLELSGRILGISMYYLLDGDGVTSSDYDVDFNGDGIYQPDASTDASRYNGNAFNTSFSDELLQGSKDGIVAVNVNKNLYNDATGTSFYQLTPYKACSEVSTGGCNPIPDGEEVNYPESLTDDQGNGEEQVKPATSGQQYADDDAFNIEIRSDGAVLTDRDNDCEPTDSTTNEDDDIQEYRVGFVSRTDDGSSDLPESVNITVHMTGPASRRDEIPHYGLRTTGRINLGTGSGGGGIYRTGDNNFDSEIRAQWVDRVGGSGYASRLYDQTLSEDPSEAERNERLSRTRGALEGVPLDQSSCSPTTP